MKQFLIIIIILFYCDTYGQQDQNWYIKNNQVLDSQSKYVQQTTNLKHYDIRKVSHPNAVGPARNDIFIIFDNGMHFNSRNLTYSSWNDDNTTTLVDSNYHLNTQHGIQHLYFTNVYEGDEEPDAFMEEYDQNTSLHYYSLNVNGIITINSNLSTPMMVMSANHSPVAGKDLTLIINHADLNTGCTYKLCIDTSFFQSRYYEFQFKESKIFGNSSFDKFVASGGGASGLFPQDYSLDAHCIYDISFSNNYKYTYVNYHLPKDPDSILSNAPLHFSIKPNVSSCDTKNHSFRDTIKDSHDPNYIQVLSVNKPANDKWSTIKYRAQCLNDGNAVQPNPSIEFTFPFPISLQNIEINNASIRNHSTYPLPFNKQAPILSSPYNNRVKFDFQGTLDFCPIPTEREECIAWVEFCLKVDSSDVNVLIDRIEPFHRNTNFGSTVYPIEKFIDLHFVNCEDDISEEPEEEGESNPEENENSPIGLNQDSLSKFQTQYCRENKICDCYSKVSRCYWYSIICNNSIKWSKLIFIIAILYLLLLLTLIFRRLKI